MNFSTMVLSMYLDADDSRAEDERILAVAVDQSIVAGQLGFNPWYTEHHFRGPWNSSPIQFASYIAPQIPKERSLGFGVLSVPFHHPVRLVEQMNLLDQLTKGRVLFGIGSGFSGIEPASAGLTDAYHGSGRAARDALDVMERLWDYESGDEPYEFETEQYRGRVVKRIMPAAYRHRRPTIIRTARNEDAVTEAARRGWPAFLGTLGTDVVAQSHLYHAELQAAGHSAEVLEECLRWSTHDWLSVLVCDRDEDAPALVEVAKAERMENRQRALQREHNQVNGPTNTHAAPTPAAFAAGNDMLRAIAGSPDTIANEVQRIADLGVNHLLVRFLGEWQGETRPITERSMELFSSEVMPRFADDVAVLADLGATRAHASSVASPALH